MAEIHENATLTPTKLELVEQWMGAQRWYAAKGRRPRLRLLPGWRLDDPRGEVGIETPHRQPTRRASEPRRSSTRSR